MNGFHAWWRFVVLYEIRRRWEQRWVWWILAIIPRDVKLWVVVQAAVRASSANDLSPGDITYKEMHDVWSSRA